MSVFCFFGWQYFSVGITEVRVTDSLLGGAWRCFFSFYPEGENNIAAGGVKQLGSVYSRLGEHKWWRPDFSSCFELDRNKDKGLWSIRNGLICTSKRLFRVG